MNTQLPIGANYLSVKLLQKGNPHEHIVCFHGFSQKSELFTQYLPLLEGKTVWGIDLFCHGDSSIPKRSELILKKDWILAMEKWFEENGIAKAECWGYSFGGRSVLTLLELLPGRVSKAVLIAPDGLVDNFWFKLSTTTPIGRSLFNWFTYNQKITQGTQQLAAKLRLVSKKRIVILAKNTSSLRKKKLIYKTWLAYRDFRVPLSKVGKEMLAHHIPMELHLGKYDKVLEYNKLYKVAKRNLPASMLKVVDYECGHKRILEEFKPSW